MTRKTKRVIRLLRVPLEWAGILVALSLIVWMPRKLLFGFCDVLSRTFYRFDRKGKRWALTNLRTVLGVEVGDVTRYNPTRREELVIRRSYRNMSRAVGYAFWTLCRAKARCRATGEMHPKAAAFLAAHQPVVTVSGHIGCWEILSQLAYLEGHEMMSVAKNIGTSGMTKLLMSARRSIGQEIVSAEGAFKPLMAGIKAGKSLGLLVDQKVSPRKGGIWIRFFSRPIPVSAAPAFFAAKAKAPVIVAWSHPLKDGRYRCEPIRTYSYEDARDVWGLTQAIAKDLETVIRRHPSCWVLNYNYFKKVPTEKDLQDLAAREAKAKGEN